MNYDISTLEFEKIKDKINNYIKLDDTRKVLNELFPSNNKNLIEKELNKTDEMRKLIISFSNIDIIDFKDLNHILKKIKIFSTLSPLELLTILEFNNNISNIIEYRKNALKENFDLNYLLEYFTNLKYFKEIKDKLNQIIDNDALILDTASNELFDIRKQIKINETKLKQKLNELVQTRSKMLTDNLIVLRNNRYCLGVKIEYKNSFKGIIHDESSSGQTVYIEPEQTQIIENAIQSLKNKEKKEIDKILYETTIYLYNFIDFLENNYNILINLDFIQAKARYAIEIDAYMPKLNNKEINLINARHPLIDKNKVVPININLGKDFNAIIITGPNTGGKTVTLKTVGLLTVMAQSGILIPADENSLINVFDNIYVDIGDEQSIEQNLSTFSSHLKKIINITNNIKDNSLVLIDELGSGTDPTEGASLAKSILKYLIKFDIRMIVTSHYHELKEFAFSNDLFTNASVLFDTETLSPTYILKIGTPGKSNAILISKRLGLNNDIILDAETNLSNSKSDTFNLIKKLEQEQFKTEKLKLELEENIKINNNLKLELEKEKNNLVSLKDEIIKNAYKKADNYIKDIKEKALNILDDIKTKTKEHEIAKVKYDLKNLNKDNLKIENDLDSHEFKINDVVYVIPLEKEGIIKEINKNKAKVQLGNLKLEYDLSSLRFIRTYNPIKQKNKINNIDTSNIKKQFKLELDLRGLRYEEAKLELDKYFDTALFLKMKQFRIIHGFGTGTIRKLVWDYLKNNKYVKEYRYGAEGEGLNGCTVVYLK